MMFIAARIHKLKNYLVVSPSHDNVTMSVKSTTNTWLQVKSPCNISLTLEQDVSPMNKSEYNIALCPNIKHCYARMLRVQQIGY